jgi:hypothetical protein
MSSDQADTLIAVTQSLQATALLVYQGMGVVLGWESGLAALLLVCIVLLAMQFGRDA